MCAQIKFHVRTNQIDGAEGWLGGSFRRLRMASAVYVHTCFFHTYARAMVYFDTMKDGPVWCRAVYFARAGSATGRVL